MQGRPVRTVTGAVELAGSPPTGLPCRSGDPELWFAESPDRVAEARARCGGCPIRVECLAGALRRAEPWGVWGGEIIESGAVVPRRRRRGRPSRAELARDRAFYAERGRAGLVEGAADPASAA